MPIFSLRSSEALFSDALYIIVISLDDDEQVGWRSPAVRLSQRAEIETPSGFDDDRWCRFLLSSECRYSVHLQSSRSGRSSPQRRLYWKENDLEKIDFIQTFWNPHDFKTQGTGAQDPDDQARKLT